MHERTIDYFVIDVLITLERLKKNAQNIKSKEDILKDKRWKKKMNKHIGSNFDDFLRDEGILEEVEVAALKSVLAYLLQKEMEEKDIPHTKMAKLLGTSRSGLARLLDPENQSVTLLTLNKVASVLGRKLEIRLH
jgi:hypothetical protein